MGIFMGMGLYLYFIRKGISAMIIPLACAGAWVGYMVVMFATSFTTMTLIGSLSIETANKWIGTVTRSKSVAFPAYFIAAGVLYSVYALRPPAREVSGGGFPGDKPS
jgi:hypothetical protein